MIKLAMSVLPPVYNVVSPLANEPKFYVQLVCLVRPFQPIREFRHGGYSLTLGITLQQKFIYKLLVNVAK